MVELPIDPSIISRRVHGQLPEMGRVLRTGLRRAVLGWVHKKDNPKGLTSGKLWCWVSAANKFQVFDTEENRADFPGPRIDCGVASKLHLYVLSELIMAKFYRFQHGPNVPSLLVLERTHPPRHEP